MARGTRILAGSLAVFNATGAILVITALFTPALVRLIGAPAYGDYATAQAVFSFVTVLAGLSLFDAVRRHHAGFVEEGAEPAHVAAVTLLLATALGALPLAAAVALWTVPAARALIPAPWATYLAIVLVGAAFFNVAGAVRGLLFVRHRETLAEGLRVIQMAVFATGAIVLALAGYGLAGVLVAFAASWAVVAVAGIAPAARGTGNALATTRGLLTEYAPPLLAFGAWSTVSVVLMQVLYHSDVLLVRYYLGAEPTGVYKAALVSAEFLWFVPVAIQTAMLHNVAELADDQAALQALVARLVRYVAIMSVVAGVTLAVLAEPFLRLYYGGAAFAAAALSLQILVVGTVGSSLGRVMTPVVMATGHIRAHVAYGALAAVINVGLNLALIPRYGIAGAAVGTGIAYGMKTLTQAHLVRLAGVRAFADTPVARIALLTLIVGAAAWVARQVAPGDLSAIALGGAAGLVAAWAAVRALRLLRPGDVDALAEGLPPPVGRAVARLWR